MDRILPGRWSKTLFTWACVVLGGSLFTYFYPDSLESVFITWGVLTIIGIGVTSYLTDWSSATNRIVQIFWALATIGFLALDVNSIYELIPMNMPDVGFFLGWSAFSSVGYLITALVSRSRQMFVAGLFSLFLLPLFSVPALLPYSALLYGIPHSAILLILAF